MPRIRPGTASAPVTGGHPVMWRCHRGGGRQRRNGFPSHIFEPRLKCENDFKYF